ncbi:probable trehalose-phosphate phosphatase 2 [Coffea eugenioides]|uniref:Trehalose 6-phosphate phosphatase n=1 Tax=Coffea arabica TaxID=13443 RepID=A0A6P6W576_COFAR|nr:probable trehalose-phosphate phosphatase 2 [Coffea arabica]XP_027162196.1 probable trehalose-phosphate phosphatase 2 [Coffea eugenioides]
MRDNFDRLYMGFSRLFGTTARYGVGYFSRARTDKIEPHEYIEDGNPDELNAADSKYSYWLKEHPSALRAFQGIMKAAVGKQIVIFLDYDGTLTPIVDEPDRAFMSDAMRSAVGGVAKHFPTAIISGRSRNKVYQFVKLDEVYYAGSHGMDIMGPPTKLKSYEGKYHTNALDKKGDELSIFQPAKEFLPAIREILDKMKKGTSDIEGVLIEDNGFCISVHYRHVAHVDYGPLEKKVLSVLAGYPRFHLTRGKKVLEIRPSIQWNKGNALVYLLDTLGFASSSSVLPIYIGDDKTDEDAFKVLRRRGLGYPIIVSSAPRDTLALCSLQDPSEVLSFLIRLARWVSASD